MAAFSGSAARTDDTFFGFIVDEHKASNQRTRGTEVNLPENATSAQNFGANEPVVQLKSRIPGVHI